MGHSNSELTSSFMEPSPLVHKAIQLGSGDSLLHMTAYRDGGC